MWDAGFQFGDWLDPDAPPDQPWRAKADPGVVATACLYRSARIVARGRRAARPRRRRLGVRRAGRRASGPPSTPSTSPTDGTVRSDCTTAYTLAIVFGLLSPSSRRWPATGWPSWSRKSGHRISTGFAGTPYVCEALARTGHLDDAYALLQQRECPSWLYPVTMGATTIWERWDSMLPDGSINPGEMTSFNHYALGAVADWMHRTVAGIAPAGARVRRRSASRPGPAATSPGRRRRSRPGTGWWRSGGSCSEGGVLSVETTLPPE